MITTQLWPYSLQIATEALNNTLNIQDKQIQAPEQIYTGIMVEAQPKQLTPFGFTAYLLDSALQQGYPFNK